MTTAQEVLNVARGYIGVAERPPRSNLTLIGEKFGWNGVPWCAEFVSICEEEAGQPFNRSASCSVLVGRYQSGENGQWLGNPGADALVAGDEFFMGTRGQDHTGFVEAVEGDTVISVEGNWGDKVVRIRRPVTGFFGFGRPNYSDAVSVPDPGPGNPPAAAGRAAMPNLVRGSKGRAVKILEQLVGASVDRGVGIFGPECQQKAVEFQRNHGLPITGRVDARMWWALMQAAFNYIIHTGLDIDGIPGPLSTSALIAFQRSSGIEIDGIAGYETFGALTGQ